MLPFGQISAAGIKTKSSKYKVVRHPDFLNQLRFVPLKIEYPRDAEIIKT